MKMVLTGSNLMGGGVMGTRLRGHAEARIDETGRLKMPAHFRKTIESTYGAALFVTALGDECLQIYPLPIWEEIEARVNGKGPMNTHRTKFLTRANRFGHEAEMDKQGRIPLKPIQRKLVEISDEVVLIGCLDHLQLWSGDKLEGGGEPSAMSAEDYAALEM